MNAKKLADPRSPALMDRKKFAKAALEVALRGSRAVVARSRLNKGMRVADISETGQITLVDSAFSNGLGRAVAIWQNHVYVAAGWAGVERYRLSAAGELELEDVLFMEDVATDVKVHARHLYVSGANGKVKVFRLNVDGSLELLGEAEVSGVPVEAWVQVLREQATAPVDMSEHLHRPTPTVTHPAWQWNEMR